MDAERAPRSADASVAAVAARQHGVVTRGQLVELGIDRGAIAHRLRCGRLHRIHQSVFAVGHPVLSRHGVWTAAVLAANPGAVLRHRSAAALWTIRETARVEAEVIVPRHRRRRPAVQVHHVRLAADEVTEQHGIPVTTPARTSLDLAEVLTSRGQLERAIHEAEYRRLTSPLSLDALLARHAGRRGTAVLREILARGRLGETITRSELEERFLAFLDAHHLPRPRTNQRIGPIEVDCMWPDARLVAEARRPRRPRDQARVRARPRPRPRAPGPGLARRAHHLAPAQRGHRDDRDRARGPPDASPERHIAASEGPPAPTAPRRRAEQAHVAVAAAARRRRRGARPGRRGGRARARCRPAGRGRCRASTSRAPRRRRAVSRTRSIRACWGKSASARGRHQPEAAGRGRRARRCGCGACGRRRPRARAGRGRAARSSARAAVDARRAAGERRRAPSGRRRARARGAGRRPRAARTTPPEPPVAAHRVEHDRAHARAEVEGVVQSRARRRAQGGRRPRPGASSRRAGSGATRSVRPGSPSRSSPSMAVGATAAPRAARPRARVGRDEHAVAAGDRVGARGARRARRPRAGRGCRPPRTTARAGRASGTAAGRRPSSPGWRGGSTSGR